MGGLRRLQPASQMAVPVEDAWTMGRGREGGREACDLPVLGSLAAHLGQGGDGGSPPPPPLAPPTLASAVASQAPQYCPLAGVNMETTALLSVLFRKCDLPT